MANPTGKSFAVVYIITKLELGGAQKVCLELSKHFPSYLISGPNGILNPNPKTRNFITIPTLQREISLLKDLHATLYIFIILLTLKNKHPFLVVHTHSSKAGIVGRIAAFFAGIKTIAHTVHGFANISKQSKITKILFNLLEQLGTFLSRKIITVSKKDSHDGHKHFWGFKKKTTLIHAGINMTPFLSARKLANLTKEENRKRGKIIIGTISCFKPQKNLFDLIKAFNLLLKTTPNPQNLVLQIIGDGEERVKLEEQIKKYNLENQIQLLGWQKNVIPHIIPWNIFALTSLWEGLPCSLIQAQTIGQIPVCYKTGGIPEAVNDGQNGYLVEQGNVYDFVKKLNLAVKQSLTKNKTVTEDEKTALFSLKTMLLNHEKTYRDFFI